MSEETAGCPKPEDQKTSSATMKVQCCVSHHSSMNRVVNTHETDCATTHKTRWSGTHSLSARVPQVCPFILYPLHASHRHGELGSLLQARRKQQNHADDAHVQLCNLTSTFPLKNHVFNFSQKKKGPPMGDHMSSFQEVPRSFFVFVVEEL